MNAYIYVYNKRGMSFKERKEGYMVFKGRKGRKINVIMF